MIILYIDHTISLNPSPQSVSLRVEVIHGEKHFLEVPMKQVSKITENQKYHDFLQELSYATKLQQQDLFILVCMLSLQLVNPSLNEVSLPE